MKILFMGTPDFAVPSLQACIDSHEVIGVFTQPDRPKGRGKKLAPPPVKVLANEHSIPVYQPEKIKTEEYEQMISDMNPDCIVVVAYGQILSKKILDVPKYGCINVHGSLLPEYRGASPIQWSIVQGETVTGITTMYMAEGLDTGDMLLKVEAAINDNTTAADLHDDLMTKGANLLLETLMGLENGTIIPVPQDDSLSSYAPILTKEMAHIDFNENAKSIIRKINGFNPWPIAFVKYKGENLKVFRAEIASEALSGSIGEIVKVDKTGLYVNCKDATLIVKEAQFFGSKKMEISQYILGHEIEVGEILS